MDVVRKTDEEQTALWNGVAGRAWVDAQEALDRLFEPLEALLVAAVGDARTVLDVGCGTGGTTVAVARRLGSKGHCIGIDISEPMIAAARDRAQRAGLPASFILADAQRHAFEPVSFDAIVSRFGVMFFDDSVAAFSNLRRSARAGAPLCFIAWRSPEENPFMTTAERAAALLLPSIPPREPDARGQFYFADRQRVLRILKDSGWVDIDIRPIDVPCALPEKELFRYITRLGPLGRVLQDADDATRARVIAAVRPAFDRYVHGSEVRFEAACWQVVARAPARGAA